MPRSVFGGAGVVVWRDGAHDGVAVPAPSASRAECIAEPWRARAG
jgi:hypothetical protein